MNPALTLAVNMASCPGVRNSELAHGPDGSVRVTVTGGNPRTVAGMILQCLPPGTPTEGPAAIVIEGTMVRFKHIDPDPTLPEDYVAPLPVVDPEGTHRPAGALPSAPRGNWPLVVGLTLLLVACGLLAWLSIGGAP